MPHEPIAIRSRRIYPSCPTVENLPMSEMAPFAQIAGDPDATLDVVALALAAEYRDVDAAGTMTRLDALGAELAQVAQQAGGTPQAEVLACRRVLGDTHGFLGDPVHYDHPDNSMLDLVLTRHRGLPILLSVV
jgi:regulator of sirC expression with transglutaminase-like and TPR domain